MAVSIPNKNQSFCVTCGGMVSVKPTSKHAICQNCLDEREHIKNLPTKARCRDCELGHEAEYINGEWRHSETNGTYNWTCMAKEGDPGPDPVSELRLRLFEADLEADEKFNHKGFYVMVLAWDIEQAKAFVQAQFNIEYEGVIDVYEDDVTFTEIEGPFPVGKILTSLHY